jgi:hypothetical protein
MYFFLTEKVPKRCRLNKNQLKFLVFYARTNKLVPPPGFGSRNFEQYSFVPLPSRPRVLGAGHAGPLEAEKFLYADFYNAVKFESPSVYDSIKSVDS